MLACTVLFIVFSPNRYSLGEWDHGFDGEGFGKMSGRIDGLTGEVQFYTASSEEDIWGKDGVPDERMGLPRPTGMRWYSFP